MTPERWQRINAVFLEAVARDAPHRQGYLDEACRDDPTLRDEVAGLLAHDATGPFLEPAPQCLPRPSPRDGPADLPAGLRVGPYEVQELIGQGGMGSVYRAARVEDYDQRVAIKVVRRGAAGPEAVHRFRAEVRFLAALGAHPHIAALLDAGTTADGLPYFVMEYVEGEPIDRYCDRHRLDVRRRLELFRAVCAAVQFAHQHTVIHRDLKPGNILVRADGTPKLIDFGIAKLLGPGAESPAGAGTRTGFCPMTPDYASPEQARGEPLTTASDVYSLGVVLYELLTGRRPYRAAAHALHEMVRIISTEVPEKPSAVIDAAETVRTPGAPQSTLPPRVGEGGEGGAERIGRNRGTPPHRLRRQLAGDLDNIVLMALRKEPERRYGTVEELAEDLRRHLAGLPVRARADTVAYRWGKFVRRNRAAVALAGVILLSLVLGVAGTTAQWLRAEANWAEARDNLAKSEHQRRRRDVNFQRLQEAVDKMLTQVGAKDLADVPRMSLVRRRLLGDALAYYQSFLEEQGDDPDIVAETARAHVRLGDIHELLDQTGEAVRVFRRARDLFADLAAGHPDRAAYRRDLAYCDYRIGKALHVQRKLTDAADQLRRAIAVQEQLRAESRDPGDILLDLANSYRLLGHVLEDGVSPPEAEGNYRTALGYYDRLRGPARDAPQTQRDYANCMDRLALRLRRTSPAEARTLAVEVFQVRRQLARAHPDEAAYQVDLAKSHRTLYREPPGAVTGLSPLDHLKAALAIWERLAADFPNVPAYQQELASRRADLGVFFDLGGHPAEAEAEFRAAVGAYERLAAANPGQLDVREALGYSYHNLGVFFSRRGNQAEAGRQYAAAVAVRQRLVDAAPGVVPYQLDLAKSVRYLGATLLKTGDRDGAFARFGDSTRQIEALVDRDPENLEVRHNLADCNLKIGQQIEADDPHQAEHYFDEAVRHWDRIVRKAPTDPRYLGWLAIATDHRGKLEQQGRRFEAAEASLRRAKALFRKRLDADPASVPYRSDYATSHNQLGHVLLDLGKFAEAGDNYREALQAREQLHRELPKNEQVRRQLASSQNLLARYLATWAAPEERDPDRARQLAERAIELHPESAEARTTLGIARYRLGRWDEAYAALREARDLSDGEPPAADEDGVNGFFLAMTHWRRGETGAAHGCYERAAARLPDGEPIAEHLEQLRREAAALLQIPSPR
jgi:serine/threonine protein kinase/Flp pilus assembly protein TadD